MFTVWFFICLTLKNKIAILLNIFFLQRICSWLLRPVPRDWNNYPGLQEDRDHLRHRLPRALRLLLVDAGGDGGCPGRGRLHLHVWVAQPQRLQHDGVPSPGQHCQAQGHLSPWSRVCNWLVGRQLIFLNMLWFWVYYHQIMLVYVIFKQYNVETWNTEVTPCQSL